jgi:uncharacterized protein YidB (DUF937 family)
VRLVGKEASMGLFDQLLGAVVGQFGSGPQRNALLDLATGVIQRHPGGLAGLIQQLTSAGLGREAGSWVSTGPNLPVSAEQLAQALGQGNVQGLGQKLGIPSETASAGLAALLPLLVDQLTPKGEVERDQDLASTLAALRGAWKA